MANLTKNYSLEKPLQTETYDVDVFNRNWDKLDEIMKSLEERSMPQVGDVIVTLSGVNPAEKYNGTIWELVEAGLYVRAAGDGFPAGEISGSNSNTLTPDNIPPHNHPGTISKAGNHSHSGSVGETDLSGNFRSRSNVFYGKGVDSAIGPVSTNGRFSVLQSGLRSEGNRDDNNLDYICHFNGNHGHPLSISESGDHTHTVTIGNTGKGKPFSVTPKARNFYIWVRTA